MKIEDTRYMCCFEMQVKHSIMSVIGNYLIIARQKSMSPNCTIAILYVSQSGLLCKVEQQEFN